MLRRDALVRTDISEEHITSIIRSTRIGELGTMLAVTNNYCEEIHSDIIENTQHSFAVCFGC
jgi:hypothetical protein